MIRPYCFSLPAPARISLLGLTMGSVRFSLYLPFVAKLCILIERTWKPAYRCPACSYPNDSDANFCQACGKPKSSEPMQGVRSNVEDVNLEKENMQAFFFVNT